MLKKISALFISLSFILISFPSFAKMSSEENTIATYLLLPDPQFCYGETDKPNFCVRNNLSVLRAIKIIQKYVKIDDAIVMGDIGMGHVWEEEDCFMAGYCNSQNTELSAKKSLSVDSDLIEALANDKISSDINVLYLRGNHDNDDWMNDFIEKASPANDSTYRAWDIGSFKFVYYDDVSTSDSVFPRLEEYIDECITENKKLIILTHNVDNLLWEQEKLDKINSIFKTADAEGKELKDYVFCMIGGHQHQLQKSSPLPTPETLESHCGYIDNFLKVRSLTTGGICTEKTFVLLRVLQNKNDQTCRLEFVPLRASDINGSLSYFDCGPEGKGGNKETSIMGELYENWGWTELKQFGRTSGEKSNFL